MTSVLPSVCVTNTFINCLYIFSFSGHGTKGVHGNVYKLAMCVLQSNLYTASRYILKIDDVQVDFSRMCDELSISLIATASAMQELT